MWNLPEEAEAMFTYWRRTVQNNKEFSCLRRSPGSPTIPDIDKKCVIHLRQVSPLSATIGLICAIKFLTDSLCYEKLPWILLAFAQSTEFSWLAEKLEKSRAALRIAVFQTHDFYSSSET